MTLWEKYDIANKKASNYSLKICIFKQLTDFKENSLSWKITLLLILMWFETREKKPG